MTKIVPKPHDVYWDGTEQFFEIIHAYSSVSALFNNNVAMHNLYAGSKQAIFIGSIPKLLLFTYIYVKKKVVFKYRLCSIAMRLIDQTISHLRR